MFISVFIVDGDDVRFIAGLIVGGLAITVELQLLR